MVTRVIKFEILLFTLSPRTFLLFAIFIITIKSGTDIMPFMTAAYIRASIGSILEKLIQSPITVDAIMIP